jgi:hypothetical protein
LRGKKIFLIYVEMVNIIIRWQSLYMQTAHTRFQPSNAESFSSIPQVNQSKFENHVWACVWLYVWVCDAFHLFHIVYWLRWYMILLTVLSASCDLRILQNLLRGVTLHTWKREKIIIEGFSYLCTDVVVYVSHIRDFMFTPIFFYTRNSFIPVVMLCIKKSSIKSIFSRSISRLKDFFIAFQLRIFMWNFCLYVRHEVWMNVRMFLK